MAALARDWKALTKRAVDLVIVLAAFVLLAAPMLVIAAVVRFKLGSPILFAQDRPGLHGSLFKMYKFRTMTQAVGASGTLLPDAQRLDEFGLWLRRMSLDELPELWNVLRGDMSLVGPRPLLVEYLEHYSPEENRRHHVRPGITGWAQINGRNAISWDEKFQLDLWYVDNQSLALDIRILWLTFVKVARQEGINGAGEATMSKFQRK